MTTRRTRDEESQKDCDDDNVCADCPGLNCKRVRGNKWQDCKGGKCRGIPIHGCFRLRGGVELISTAIIMNIMIVMTTIVLMIVLMMMVVVIRVGIIEARSLKARGSACSNALTSHSLR